MLPEDTPRSPVKPAARSWFAEDPAYAASPFTHQPRPLPSYPAMPIIVQILRVASVLLVAIGGLWTIVYLVFWLRNFTKPGFGTPDFPGLMLFGHEFSPTGYWMPVALLTLGGIGVALLFGTPRRGQTSAESPAP